MEEIAGDVPTLIELAGARVTLRGKVVLDALDWRLRAGENWVVTGPNGAGKSTFLRVVRGEQWIDHDAGRRRYRLRGDDDDVGTAKARIGYLSPEQHERLLRMELSLTVRELLSGGLAGVLYLPAEPTRDERARVERIAAALGLTSLLEEPMNGLSFGQFRRALLGRALAGKPRVLVLDEFSHGIDRQSRDLIAAALESASVAGTPLVVATHRTDDLPAWITHELRLEKGRIAYAGPLRPLAAKARARGARTAAEDDDASGAPLVLRLANVDVYHDGRRVLGGINWEIRAGRHWFVSGPNGAGKTTLAKLLYGRLRAAYGVVVERFDWRPNVSVDQIRSSVALISDDEQLRYDWSIPVESVVVSGFFHSVGLMQRPSPEQMATVERVIDEFAIGHLRRRPFLELSFGERRMVLVARALVRTPQLLVLDEALNGFDREARARILHRVEQLVAGGTTVVMIGHHESDVPEWIENELRLENGRVSASARRLSASAG